MEKMKKRMAFMYVVPAFLIGTLFSSTAIAAESMFKAFSVPPVINMNGQTSASMPAFIHNGTTYVELYALEHALNVEGIFTATWNGHQFSVTSPSGFERGYAILSPQNGSSVHGSVVLDWDALTDTLTVVEKVSGLVPYSVHPTHIHLASTGAMLYPLSPLQADKDGNATSLTVIPNITALPNGTWDIKVHQGPDMTTPAGQVVISQGRVTTATPSGPLRPQ